MSSRRSFERRLRVSLIVFSLAPTLLLVAVGAWAVRGVAALSGSGAAWERVAESGAEVIRLAEDSGDPALAAAARAHREELSNSVMQSRRWEYLSSRAVPALAAAALVLAGVLFALARRAARRMARGLSRPVAELVEWAQRLGRGEPLPERPERRGREASDFGLLRDAFRRMAGELEVSRARELEAERQRTWIGMARRVAHELKNPLTPMRFALRTLERTPPATPAEAEAREVLLAEAERLEELARAFAQFGRLPDGPESEVDLREMLEGLLRTHLADGVAHRLRAPVDLPPVRGHHDALARAFANLLLNAGDAVGPGGSVQVVLRAVDGSVEVRVLDSGPGVPPEILERIWEPDFSTKTRGTGLGLALVRQTVQAHGGSATARNRPEGGAEFRVLLPAGARETSGVAPA